MAFDPVRLISRSSPLAIIQVDEVLPLLKTVLSDTTFSSNTSETIGDIDLKTPLTETNIPDDFFSREVDQALLSQQADIGIHSAKDYPEEGVKGLSIAALLPAKDIRDVLVYRKNLSTDKPPRSIGTSSPRREAYLKEIMPDVERRPIRGSIGERIEQLDAGKYDAVIIAACALDRLSLSHRATHYLDIEAAPQQGRLALVVRSEDTRLLNALAKLDVRRKAGLVALVGCPCDASLLSHRAESLIDEADVIFHDRLIPDQVLQRIALKARPVGKIGHEKSTSQAEIHRLILEAAEQGQLVVRLHGGDPGILGHLGETLEFLADWNIRADIVPAVTAAQVAAAKGAASLTHRYEGKRLTLLSAHTAKPEKLELPSPKSGHLAIYMGVAARPVLQQALRDAGWSDTTSIMIAQRMGYHDEEIVPTTLDQMTNIAAQRPAVILVGPKPYAVKPYALFTGTNPKAFSKYGPLLHLPFIQLVQKPLTERAKKLHAHLKKINGIIFPSRFAVDTLMETLLATGDVRDLAGKTLLTVGPGTRDTLKTYGLKADASPETFGGVHALAKELPTTCTGSFLYPCSDKTPLNKRRAALAKINIELVPQNMYHNRALRYAELPRLAFDRVIFTSSSTARAYFENFPDELKANRTWIGVGTSTLEQLDALGCPGELLEDNL